MLSGRASRGGGGAKSERGGEKKGKSRELADAPNLPAKIIPAKIR